MIKIRVKKLCLIFDVKESSSIYVCIIYLPFGQAVSSLYLYNT